MPRSTTFRMQWVAVGIVLPLILSVGCKSDSPAGPDAVDTPSNSPGTGSGTLQVTGVVEIEDEGAGDYVTHFRVTVADGSGSPVSEAVVIFEAEFGSRTLPEDGETPGLYQVSREGHVPGWYRLSVQAGDDYLSGLTVRAPSAHAITYPAPNQVVTADAILNVRWIAPDEALECRLRTLDYDSSWINGDTQTLWVPGVGNPPRDDQSIRVQRRNTQFSTAGLAGTRLSASIHRTVEPIVAQ